MDFCSEYGYNYGFDGSDSEEYDDEEERVNSRRKKKVRKADTNIIAVKFDKLISPNEMFAGEPKPCKQCGAYMSYLSEKNVVRDDEKLSWKCEFCENLNDMTSTVLDMNEIPKKDDVTFMLELPKPKEETVASAEDITIKEVSSDDSFLSFCIDVSGSMNSRIANTGFTRLNGVQSACVDTLKKLKDEEPNRRANLVTFTDQVRYFGDCTNNRDLNPSVVINQDVDLNNKERISTLAHNVGEEIKPIKETHALIEQKIKQLRPEGYTALGPALLFCVDLASKKAGSSIILCTDGCANRGVGDIENRDRTAESEKFYEEIAEKAKEKGVMVNIITMEGTDCKLALLRKVADLSNGQMNIVNPLNLKDEFKTIVENRIVATMVHAKLIVSHRYLYIRDDNLESEEGRAIDRNDQAARELLEARKKSVDTRNIGNCTIDSEITFEYGLRKIKDEKKENLKKLPFQLQITYTTRDGTKAVRVYTKELEFTTDREKAESNITSEAIVLTHHGQMMSKQYLDYNVFQSKCRSHAADLLYKRAHITAPSAYNNYSDQIKNTSKYASSKQYADRQTNDSYLFSKMSRMKMSKFSDYESKPKLNLIKDDDDQKKSKIATDAQTTSSVSSSQAQVDNQTQMQTDAVLTFDPAAPTISPQAPDNIQNDQTQSQINPVQPAQTSADPTQTSVDSGMDTNDQKPIKDQQDN